MNSFSYPATIHTIYDGPSERILDFLGSPSIDIIGKNMEEWQRIIHSHIRNILSTKNFVELQSFDDEAYEWVNTRPLTLEEDLENKVVVLDFFTYCCINCEQTLPFVKEIAGMVSDNPALVVIGVHSPKFINERDLDSIKNAVKRNHIKHPVLHDVRNYLWTKLDITCWPSVIILSPDHRVLFSLIGEIHIQKLKYICETTMNFFQLSGIHLNMNVLHFEVLEDDDKQKKLLYPTGIANVATSSGPTLIVSDTGHHRLLLVSYSGTIVAVIGNGNSGREDGSYDDSRFNNPHGVAIWRQRFVFVADTGNNCIRLIDLETKMVSTVFNGEEDNKKDAVIKSFDLEECQSYIMVESDPSKALINRFASPWDLCIASTHDKIDDPVLYIAVAGAHQIWSITLNEEKILSRSYSDLCCEKFAGSGKEQCRNSKQLSEAAFAQPSGIAYSVLHPTTLFIADSESSSVRSISLSTGEVKTIVGASRDHFNLMEFGDKDGTGYDAKLQHPLGICTVANGKLLIADSYNHKIKIIDILTQKCQTFAGSGKKGGCCNNQDMESATFNEPNGITSSSDGKLIFVTDTNNHSIRIIDIEHQLVKHMKVHFPESSCTDGHVSAYNYQNCESHRRSIKLKYDGIIKCFFRLKPERGVELNKEFSPSLTITTQGRKEHSVEIRANILTSVKPSLKFIFEETEENKSNEDEKMFEKDEKKIFSEIHIVVNYSVCKGISKTCHPVQNVVMLEVEFCNYGRKTAIESFYF